MKMPKLVYRMNRMEKLHAFWFGGVALLMQTIFGVLLVAPPKPHSLTFALAAVALGGAVVGIFGAMNSAQQATLRALMKEVRDDTRT